MNAMTQPTKRQIISALFLTCSGLGLSLPPASALAQVPAPAAQVRGNVLELAENAPDRHVVVKGDTLWGISGIFLKQPWRWPEIWQLNKEQIKNPHWIYPGQIIYLDRSGDQPRLRIGNPLGKSGPGQLGPQTYATDNRLAITSIPQKIIEPFLSQPLIVEAGALDQAPRIVATQEDRVVVGTGNTIYATDLPKAKLSSIWMVYRPGKPLIDPETRQVLGYEAFYLGNAQLVREGVPNTQEILAPEAPKVLAPETHYPGEFRQIPMKGMPATLEITKSLQEIGQNDRLVPAPPPGIVNYIPHAPDRPINGRIMSVYGAVEEGASHSIVTLSRGAKDGVEVGHVLALSRAGVSVSNRYQDKLEAYQLPDERYGLLFVFRVFDRVSYALVMNVNRPVIVGDAATTP